MIIKEQEDIHLIQNILNGNQVDEEILYNKYKKIIKDFILSKHTTYNDIDDDVSEILIKIFLNLKNYDENKSKFKSWVLTITKNYLIDKWRCSSTGLILNNTTFTSSFDSHINNQTITIGENNTGFITTCSNTLCNFENNSTVTYLSKQLSPNDYALLDMKYIQGYNYNEIGREFQITSNTVSNRINYIKTKLKKQNTDEYYS